MVDSKCVPYSDTSPNTASCNHRYHASPVLNISDGGHADNSGLLPLFKKRVDKIILADSSTEFGGPYIASDLQRTLQQAREYFNCSFTGMAGEDIVADMNWKFIDPPNGYKPRCYRFKVQYHDFNADRSEFVQVGEGEVIVMKARHPNDGNAGVEQDISSWECYSKTTGKDLEPKKWGTGPKLDAHDVDRLTGCCCELCHCACLKSCCSPISGSFPDHSTLNLTYTSAMFAAYHREGYRANVEALVKEFLTDGTTTEKKSDPITTQPS